MTRISASQFFWLLFAGRLSNCLLLPSESLHALSVPDLLAVTALNALVLLVVWLPTRWAYRHGGVHFSMPVRVGYALLALFVLYLDVLQFGSFAARTVKTEFSVDLLTAALVVVGLLGAMYGLEVIGRAATVIAAVGLLILFTFVLLLLPHMQSLCFPPATFSGFANVLSHTVRELPRTAEVAILVVLYPSVKEKTGRAYGWFIGMTAVLTLSVCVVTTGVLGAYAGETAYPFYTAVTAASPYVELAAAVLWLGTFFVRVVLFGTVYLEQIRRLLGERACWPAVGLGAAALIGMVLVSENGGPWRWLTYLYIGALVLFAVAVPLMARKRRNV